MDTINELQTTYEISFIVKGEDVAEVKKLIEECQGVVQNEKPLEKVTLAYPVKKEKQGFKGVMVINSTKEDIKKLEEKMRFTEGVLRCLIQKKKKTEKKIERSSEEEGYKKTGSENKIGLVPKEAKKMFEPALTNEALEKQIEEISKEQ